MMVFYFIKWSCALCGLNASIYKIEASADTTIFHVSTTQYLKKKKIKLKTIFYFSLQNKTRYLSLLLLYKTRYLSLKINTNLARRLFLRSFNADQLSFSSIFFFFTQPHHNFPPLYLFIFSFKFFVDLIFLTVTTTKGPKPLISLTLLSHPNTTVAWTLLLST